MSYCEGIIVIGSSIGWSLRCVEQWNNSILDLIGWNKWEIGINWIGNWTILRSIGQNRGFCSWEGCEGLDWEAQFPITYKVLKIIKIIMNLI